MEVNIGLSIVLKSRDSRSVEVNIGLNICIWNRGILGLWRSNCGWNGRVVLAQNVDLGAPIRPFGVQGELKKYIFQVQNRGIILGQRAQNELKNVKIWVPNRWILVLQRSKKCPKNVKFSRGQHFGFFWIICKTILAALLFYFCFNRPAHFFIIRLSTLG